MSEETAEISEEELRRIQRSYTDWYEAWYANLNLPKAPNTKDLLEQYGGNLIKWSIVYEIVDEFTSVYEEPSS